MARQTARHKPRRRPQALPEPLATSAIRSNGDNRDWIRSGEATRSGALGDTERLEKPARNKRAHHRPATAAAAVAWIGVALRETSRITHRTSIGLLL